jgi:hypothetical protein
VTSFPCHRGEFQIPPLKLHITMLDLEIDALQAQAERRLADYKSLGSRLLP